jgi:diaminopimelate epimerase
MSIVPFRKMHGLGNDFVVIDARRRRLPLTAAQAAAIADRHTGIGCDQLILVERPQADAQADLRFFNADGSESGACGNGTRCVASLLLAETGRNAIRLDTRSGRLEATVQHGLVTVDMGRPRLDWQDVPLARETDTLDVALGEPAPGAATCCSMGNPHATIFVPDADAVPLERIGPVLEHHPMFPERANIGIATVETRDRLRLRVWERGAGLTLACGTGACAALVAAARRGFTGRRAEIVMARGSLQATWRADDHVLLAGPVATSFTGEAEI